MAFFSERLLEVEHIVPVARGGEDTIANWALACRACNLYKAAHVSGRDPASDAVSTCSIHAQTSGRTISRLLPRAERFWAYPHRQSHGSTFGDKQRSPGRSTAAVDAPGPFPLGRPGLTRHCT